MEKHPLIRKIYLYLATLIGLVMMIIAGVQLVNLGLKTYIFTEIEKQDVSYQRSLPYGPMSVEKTEVAANSTAPVQLTESERASMKSWLADYKKWQEDQKGFDPVKAQRQRDAATALAMIIIGLPLFLYHWGVVRRESKKEA